MPIDDRSTIERALATFIDAFTSLDRPRMEACFTDNATVFHRVSGPRCSQFWDDAFEVWRTTRPGPPYLSIEPKELQVQDLGDVAVVTFHLDNRPGEIGRRSLVLTRTPEGWKIVHLHASVMATEE